MDITVVNIISVSYSGSTWVNLMLGSHPEAFSVGEIKSILKLGRPVCTLHGDDCPVWQLYETEGRRNPFEQIARITGSRVLVVNNSRKFLSAQRQNNIRAKFIHLIRDGRAVAASFLRKFPERTMWRVARLWSHDVRRDRRLIRRQPHQDALTLVYEKVKADTEGEMRRVCDFIGMDYNPAMLAYWDREHHFLGGNKGTLLSMATKQDATDKVVIDARQKRGEAPNWDLDYYRHIDPATFVDERWKQELTDKQLRVFALAAGRLNRRLGYPKSLQR